jgi:hypothetical protein
MGAAVAYAAIRRGRIALRKFLAVHALGVFARLFLVAGGAGRFGGAGRVRIFLVTVVAGVAGQGRVSALGEFGLLIVTGGAVGARVFSPEGGDSHPQEKEQKRQDPPSSGLGCPAH